MAAKKPPSDLDRLRMFCALVDEYDDIAAALPVDPESSFDVNSGARPAEQAWRRILRAMTLRKFIFGVNDQVYVPTVLDSLDTCLRDGVDRNGVDAMREPIDNAWIRYVDDEGNEVTANEVIKDLMYGNVLHADHNRWIRSSSEHWTTIDLACFQFLTGHEYYVRKVRDVIRAADAEGLLRERL